MDILQNFGLFAAYNRWANRLVYSAAEQLDDEEYFRDVSAFFKSMHGTLNHILVADRVWLKRFTGTGSHPSSLDAIIADDLQSLTGLRIIEDQRINEWVGTIDEERLTGSISFTPITNPGLVTQKLGPCLSHFFNHQTHHRGHAHMILSVLGKNPPSLDMVAFVRNEEGKEWQ